MRGLAPASPGTATERFVKQVRLELRALGDRLAALAKRVADIEDGPIRLMPSEPAPGDKENGMIWLDGTTVVVRSNDADVPL